MVLGRVLLDVAPLRVTAFRRLFVGRVFSGFGNQMTLVAVMFQVWSMTGSTVWTGAVGLAMALPIVVFGLFAGSLVDRVDRRRFYLVTVAGQAFFGVLLVVQGFVGGLPVGGVLAIVALQSCFVAGGGPASRTFIPRLLPKEQVAAGLALNRIGFQGAVLLGPALGGVLIGWVGVGGCYLVDVVMFGVAFHGAFGLPAMVPEGEPSRAGVRGVVDGLVYLVREPVVRGALLTDLAAMVLSMPISLFPLVNAERFGGDPRTFGLFLTAIAVGGVVGSVFSGTFTRLARPGVVMIFGALGWGVSLVLFGISTNPWVGLGFLVLAGVADTVSVVSRGALVQLHTPDSMMGRVAAAEQIVGQAGPDLGNMRGGLVAGATSGVFSLVSGGLMCVAAVALVGAATPGLRRATVQTPV